MARQGKGYLGTTFRGDEADKLRFIRDQEGAATFPETVRRLCNLYFLMYPEKKVAFETRKVQASVALQEGRFNGLLGILPLDLLGLEQGPASAACAV